MAESKRTINEVLNYETGECIDANDFFDKHSLEELIKYRSELQRAIEGHRELLFVCYYCKQKIRIRGGRRRGDTRKIDIFHFAHLKDSDDCHIKTQNSYSKEEIDRMKYNGAKESPLHIKLKNTIAEYLIKNGETKGEVSSIEVEKIIHDKNISKEWKKPDINAYFKDKRIAIELQLSTTWLDVITQRQHFYKKQGIYIFWIFHEFNLNDDNRKLTYDDVIYTNNQNAYVFDEESLKKSKLENDFVFKCYYKTYYKKDDRLNETWNSRFIRLSDLHFDDDSYRAFFFDVEAQKKDIEEEISQDIKRFREAEEIKKGKEQRIEEIENSEKKIIQELNVQNEILTDIPKYVEKVSEYFIKQDWFRQFYGNELLLNKLKKKFSTKLNSLNKSITINKGKKDSSIGKLTWIKNHRKVQIEDIEYTVLDSINDVELIKSKQDQIVYINKSRVDLFAQDELKKIKNEYELNRLLAQRDILLLINLTTQNREFIIEQDEIEKNIMTGMNEIKKINKEMSETLEAYLKEDIAKVTNQLDLYRKEKERLLKEL